MKKRRVIDMAILKTKLHELRKERNMQQAELATLVGVRRETIGNLENGKYNPSLKLAMDIAKVFDRTVEEIFFFEEDGEAVYVGEAENLLLRLKQHIQSHKKGTEKFFWQTAVCVSGKDLNKALIKYLENFYCLQVKMSSKYELLTQKSSPQMTLKRAELAAMEEFTDNVNMLIGAIGYSILESSTGASSQERTFFYCRTKTGADAKGFNSESGFTVCAGSKIVEQCASKTFQERRYFDLFEKLKESGVIENGTFIKEYTFSSPTAAADIVTQSIVSGNEYWSDENGKKLKEYNI